MEPMQFYNVAGYWILMPLAERESWEKVGSFFDWKNAEEEAAWLHEQGDFEAAAAIAEAPNFWALRDENDLARVEELLEIPDERRQSTRGAAS